MNSTRIPLRTLQVLDTCGDHGAAWYLDILDERVSEKDRARAEVVSAMQPGITPNKPTLSAMRVPSTIGAGEIRATARPSVRRNEISPDSDAEMMRDEMARRRDDGSCRTITVPPSVLADMGTSSVLRIAEKRGAAWGTFSPTLPEGDRKQAKRVAPRDAHAERIAQLDQLIASLTSPAMRHDFNAG